MPQDGLFQLIDGWAASVFTVAAVVAWFVISLRHPNQWTRFRMPWFKWRLACLLPLFSLLITLSLATALLLSWISKIPGSFRLPLRVALEATCYFWTGHIEVSLTILTLSGGLYADMLGSSTRYFCLFLNAICNVTIQFYTDIVSCQEQWFGLLSFLNVGCSVWVYG